MIDYFLSGFDGCCLNCLEEERRIICSSGIWCDRCLCLKGCEYYRLDLGGKRGYCGIRKQLLDKLESENLENPEGFLRWLKQLKSEGIRIPKAVREMTERDRQVSYFERLPVKTRSYGGIAQPGGFGEGK
ncbi:hypothetical protein LR013_04605 [candidate division NPL-UPA2 bacterium]|nr:hypothetical protein [candidate division NPL-UPA2 bacterium]